MNPAFRLVWLPALVVVPISARAPAHFLVSLLLLCGYIPEIKNI